VLLGDVSHAYDCFRLDKPYLRDTTTNKSTYLKITNDLSGNQKKALFVKRAYKCQMFFFSNLKCTVQPIKTFNRNVEMPVRPLIPSHTLPITPSMPQRQRLYWQIEAHQRCTQSNPQKGFYATRRHQRTECKS